MAWLKTTTIVHLHPRRLRLQHLHPQQVIRIPMVKRTKEEIVVISRLNNSLGEESCGNTARNIGNDITGNDNCHYDLCQL